MAVGSLPGQEAPSRQFADTTMRKPSGRPHRRRLKYNSRINLQIVLADNFVFQKWEEDCVKAICAPSAIRID